jgi:hypothetical protein
MKKLPELMNVNPVDSIISGGVESHTTKSREPSDLTPPKNDHLAVGLEAIYQKGLSTPRVNHGLRRVSHLGGVTHWRPNYDRPQEKFLTVRSRFEAIKAEAEAEYQQLPICNDIATMFTVKLEAWVKTMTPAQLSAKRTIAEIINLAGLTGRTKDAASVQQAGIALRRAGFEPTRDYTKGGHNRRYWIYKDQ